MTAHGRKHQLVTHDGTAAIASHCCRRQHKASAAMASISAERAATFVDKIFKGTRPGDIPIEQATRFEIIVNMKTANALGIKIPQAILVQATKLID